MATITRKIDDLDNNVTEDVTTYTVTVRSDDGTRQFRFTIDLGEVNGGKLETALAKFRKAGTDVPFAPAVDRDSEVSKIRQWAITHGFNVKDRGALPKEVKDAYAQAHPEGEQSDNANDATDDTTDE